MTQEQDKKYYCGGCNGEVVANGEHVCSSPYQKIDEEIEIFYQLAFWKEPEWQYESFDNL